MFINTSEVSIGDEVIARFPVIIRAVGSLSVHEVELRISKDGHEYYLFHYKRGTSAINYTKGEFDQLSKVIPIEKESIFYCEDQFNGNSKIFPVNEDYINK